MLASLVGSTIPINAVVTSVVGGAMAGYGIALRGDACAMQSWPQVSGVICQAFVDEFFDRGSGPSDTGLSMYGLVVAYDYAIDGREYRGHRIGVAATSASWRSYAESIIARYPLNHEVTVYYNPADPKDALLERATAPSWAAGTIARGFLLAAGGLVWAFSPLGARCRGGVTAKGLTAFSPEHR